MNLVPQSKGLTEFEKLHENLEKMSKRLEELEISLKERGRPSRGQPRGRGSRSYSRNPRQPSMQACWLCGEIGHFQRDCPLNLSGPAPAVGGWP